MNTIKLKTYKAIQLERIGHSGFSISISGDKGRTNFLNISALEFQAIKEILLLNDQE